MLFTPKLIALSNQDQKTPMNATAGALGQRVYVVPRAACSFRRFRLKGASRSALKAIEYQAMNEAVPGHDQLKIIRDPDKKHASVWSYSRASVPGFRSLPESLCYEPMESGVRLLECLSGFEGQIWDQDILVASRWWHSLPSTVEWAAFLRAAPADFPTESVAIPTAAPASFADHLPLIDFDKHDIVNIITPTRAAFVAASIIAFSTAYVTSQYFYYSYRLASVESQKTDVSEEANLILSKRRRALANISRIQDFSDISPNYSLIGGLSSVAQVMEGQEAKFQSLRVQDEAIEIRLLGETTMRVSELVSRLEQTQALADVSVTGSQRGSLVIRASFKGKPAGDATAQGAQ